MSRLETLVQGKAPERRILDLVEFRAAFHCCYWMEDSCLGLDENMMDIVAEITLCLD